MPVKEEPVRVKLYGVFSKTKSSYLAQQGFAVLLTAVLLLVWFNAPSLDDVQPQLDPRVEVEMGTQRPRLPAEVELLIRAMNTIPWLVAGLLSLIALETFFVLRAFARKEAEAQAKAAEASLIKVKPPADTQEARAIAETPVNDEVPSPDGGTP